MISVMKPTMDKGSISFFNGDKYYFVLPAKIATCMRVASLSYNVCTRYNYILITCKELTLAVSTRCSEP